ncbi:MAG: SPFH domain-containing protein [Planctomycetota bacterium]
MVRLEVIDFFDSTGRTLVQRVPAEGSTDIKLGAQLIVQESQEAVFFRDGKALDTFGPGRHTLTTANVPLITRLLTIPWERSPFQAQVYFVGKQTFLDQKWGTKQPVTLRDKDFGIVRLRSFGKFSFRVTQSALFVNTLVGTQGKYTTDDVSTFLKDLIVSKMTDVLGTANISLLDLPAKFEEIAAATRVKLSEDYAKYGLELVDFFINSITPPEEVQKAIDARSSMGAIGDLHSFTMYQAANSMAKMAEQGNASGANAMGLGFGAGFGMMFPQMMQQAMWNTPRPNMPPGGLPPQTPPGAAPGMPGGPVPPPGGPTPPPLPGLDLSGLAAAPRDPRAMLRSIAQSNSWAVVENGDAWQLTIPVGSLRKQVITAQLGRQDPTGQPLISYSTTCGPANDQSAMQLLRYNTQLVHGAFAVVPGASGDVIVLQANQLVNSADPLETTRILSALAWQADQVEEKLLGTDSF